MKTAVIYARYSSERQTEQSIEGQIRECTAFAKRNDILIVNTYIDRAMTGTNDNRNDFQRMLKDCTKRAWDIVLVYKLDRFSRNKYEMAMHKKTLRDNGIKLVSAMENIPDSPEGIILESLLEGMAEYYSVELSQKVRRGMRESRIKEQFIGGHILYGYKVVNKKVEIDEDKAEVVRFIYEQYANDVIVKDIIQKLTDRGILNNGKPFARNTIYQILKNEKYSGVYRYGDEVFLNTYPRIVSKEIYDKVALKVADNRYGKKSNGAVFLLRQKMKCGYCGKTLTGESGTSSTGKVKYYYKCLGRKRGTKCELDVFRKEVIEEAIIEAICKTIDSSEIMSSLADDVLELQDLKEKDMSVVNILREEKEKLQKNIDNIMSAIEQGLFSATAQKRLSDLEARMEEINASIILEQSKNKVNITKDEIIKYFKTVLKKEPQQMIFLFVKEIIVYNDKIEVYCNYTNRKNPDGSNHQDFCFYTDNVIFHEGRRRALFDLAEAVADGIHIFIENLGDGLEILRRERGESVFLRLHDGRDQLFAERSARFGEPYDLVVARAGNGFQISEFFQA